MAYFELTFIYTKEIIPPSLKTIKNTMRATTIFILYIFLHLASPSAWAGDNVLQLSIIGKSYEKLQLKINMSYGSEFIQGSNLGDNLWEFHIPDSIYERGQRMMLIVPTNNSVIHNFTFTISPQDKTTIAQFYVKKRYSRLNLEYISGGDTLKNMPFYRNKDVVFDNFLVSTDDFEFEANKKRFFMGNDLRHNSYSNEEIMNKYISLVKEYPDSHLLITYLYLSLREYESQDNIENILRYFSDQAKNSYYGQLIQEYLHPKKFPNMLLQVLGKTSREPVIVNKGKEHLVVFTASWCAPCHKLIPVLKELYGKLKDKMEFTYISIDDARTIDNWPKVIQKNEIPWRCLTATDQLDEVMATYTIQGIPLAYHVAKDGSFKEVNLQNAEERDKLIQEMK